MALRLRGRLVLALATTTSVAVLLVLASRASLSTERALKAEGDRLVSALADAALRTTAADGLAEARAALDDNQKSQIGIRNETGRLAQVAYFIGRRLVAIDRRDERGDTIRRDYLDLNERVRIRAFYGNGSEYLVHYLNDRDVVVRVETLGPVPIGVRPTYGG